MGGDGRLKDMTRIIRMDTSMLGFDGWMGLMVRDPLDRQGMIKLPCRNDWQTMAETSTHVLAVRRTIKTSCLYSHPIGLIFMIHDIQDT